MTTIMTAKIMGFTQYSHWTFVSYRRIVCRALHRRCVLMEERRTSMLFWMWLENPRSSFTLPSWTMFLACCMPVIGQSWCCIQAVFSPLLVVSDSGVCKVFFPVNFCKIMCKVKGGPYPMLSLGRVLISLTWAFQPVGG